MGYSYLNNIELEEALDIFLAKIKECKIILGIEIVPVQNSLGRVTAEAVYAGISSPHYNACAMDGIALFARNTFGASDTTPVILKEGADFIRVDTGDPLPNDYDAVVMIEDVIELGNGEIKLLDAATPWQHVRQIGEDICANEMIITSNTKVEPSAIGALMAGGVLDIKVWKKPVVGVIPTGDEIVSPTDNPNEGEIIEFNSAIFSSMLESWGAISKVYGIVPDEYDLIREAVVKASQECDMIILNAGSSAGREDFSSKVIGDVGEVFIHGIAIRPGKPTILGIVNRRPIIGVPGYPVSGILVMENITKRVLEFFTKISYHEGITLKATLSRKIVSSLKYKEFVRMKLGNVGNRLIATPLNRGAGVVTSFVRADGIFEIPINSEGFESGREIDVRLLKTEEEIRNTLVSIGSHDPLIDVAADIMRKKYPGDYVSSAHVGSLGGIMAIKRNEAHVAGIHLLDEETGGYNLSYIKKYLGDNKTYLVKCVKRQQGLMVASGNPLGISGLDDIWNKDTVKKNINYVNRQKGSGTRILLDYLLKEKNIASSLIYGYEREEFTHLNVAALVKSGSADVGMGILSAAKAYNLDFIPICEEQYDFIIPEQFIELSAVKKFIEILKSVEFKNTLEDLGGYIVDGVGEVILV